MSLLRMTQRPTVYTTMAIKHADRRLKCVGPMVSRWLHPTVADGALEPIAAGGYASDSADCCIRVFSCGTTNRLQWLRCPACPLPLPPTA